MTQLSNLAVMFADLSGSTRLYDKLGDQRAVVIVEHCVEIFSNAAVARGGRVIKEIGDEILAVFNAAAPACHAAMDMQLGLLAYPDAVDHMVSMHTGVHWGEVTVTEDDVFGDTVIVASRLVAKAKRGQILVSGVVF